MVKFLLKSGAKLNAKDKLGHLPLYVAEKVGNFEIIRLIKRKEKAQKPDENENEEEEQDPEYLISEINQLRDGTRVEFEKNKRRKRVAELKRKLDQMFLEKKSMLLKKRCIKFRKTFELKKQQLCILSIYNHR